MNKELTPPNTLFVSFMTSRMLGALQTDPDQDINKLYASIIEQTKGYNKFDWGSVKNKIFEKVEAAAVELHIGGKAKKTKPEETQTEPKAQKAKPKIQKKEKSKKATKAEKQEEEEEAEEEQETEAEPGIHLPKKIKTKKGAEQAIIGGEVHVSGKPGKVGVKCGPGEEARERVVDEHTKAYGCQRARKGQI